MIKVFVRDWWKKDAQGNVVPAPGARETKLCHVDTADEARAECKAYNDSHEPGWRSRKAEFRDE